MFESTLEVPPIGNFRMRTSCYVILFLILANSFSISSVDAKLHDNQIMNYVYPTAEINIANGLPLVADNAHTLSFDCDEGGHFELRPKQTHKWQVPGNKVEACRVRWAFAQFKTIFNAFDAESDLDHVVYWLVQLNGFYHSWNNFVWERKARWQHWS